MSERKLAQTVTVTNPQGLHLRVASRIAQCAGQFEAKIEVIKNNERVDGKGAVQLITLGAGQGTVLSIEATGRDAAEALEALVKLFESGFTEEKQDGPSPEPPT